MGTIQARVHHGGESYDDGHTCIREYLVAGGLLTSQTPVQGEVWGSHSSWPSGYYVASWRFNGQFRVGSENIDILEITGTKDPYGSALLIDTVIRQQGDQQFTVTADHLGARKATWEDAGYHNDPRVRGPRVYFGEKPSGDYECPESGRTATLTGDNWRTLLPGGSRATLRSYVYKNSYQQPYFGELNGVAHIMLRADESAGTQDGALSPFTDKDNSSLSCMALTDIGRIVSIVTHTVTYYVSTNSGRYSNVPPYHNHGLVSDWGPAGGDIYGPLNASENPAESGQWRIAGQRVEQAVDRDGSPLLKITRQFLRVPYEWPDGRWNPNLFPNWSADWP